MEVLISFNKSIWNIGSNGFRKVTTLDYSRFSTMFERLFAAQNDLVLEGQEKKELEAFQSFGWQARENPALPVNKEKIDLKKEKKKREWRNK